MATDLLAIADAIAGNYLSGTVPTDAPELVGATARLPNGIPATPYILVLPPSGTLGPREAGITQSQVHDTHDFDVYLLLNKASGDLPTDLARVYAWWPFMRYAMFGREKLGLAPAVLKAITTEDYDFDNYEYEGQAYYAWHFVVRVWTEDIVAVTL
jgi:hypothetical protein